MAETTNMYDLYDYIDIDELLQWIEEQVSEKIVKDIIDSEPMYYSVDRDMVNKFCKK